jgi:L,D-peptidoglycan transpeptidase YkuD (ErfK/YbiS/YcfS/YnhG family)
MILLWPMVSPTAADSVGRRQRVIIDVASTKSTSGTLTLVEIRDGTTRILVGPVTARLGRNGVSANHREGDGTTPLGTFALTSAFGTAARPKSGLGYSRLREGDCWVSDATDPKYNSRVSRGVCGAPNEDLYRIGRAGPYRLAIVTDYNMSPVVAGRGSAIFLHVNAVDESGRSRPTSGCVSVSYGVMLRLVSSLDAAARPTLTVRLKR